MRRQGGGFGIVVLVVVTAIILLLVSRAWKSVMPTAAQVAKPGAAAREVQATQDVQDTSQPAAGESVAPLNMPDLKKTQANTDAHTRQVSDTQKAAD